MDTLADAAARRRPLNSSSDATTTSTRASTSTPTTRPSSALSIQFLLDGSASRPFFVGDHEPEGGVDHSHQRSRAATSSPRTPDQVDDHRSPSSEKPSSFRAASVVLPRPGLHCRGDPGNRSAFLAYPHNNNQAIMAPQTRVSTATQPLPGPLLRLPSLADTFPSASPTPPSSSSSSSSVIPPASSFESSFSSSSATTAAAAAAPWSAMPTSSGAVLDLQVLSRLFLQSLPYPLPTFVPSPSATTSAVTTPARSPPTSTVLPSISSFLSSSPPPSSPSCTPTVGRAQAQTQQQPLQPLQHQQMFLSLAHLHYDQQAQALPQPHQYQLHPHHYPLGSPSPSVYLAPYHPLPAGAHLSSPLTSRTEKWRVNPSRAGERPVHPSQPNREGGALTGGGGGGCDRSTMLESILARAERNAGAERGLKRAAAGGPRHDDDGDDGDYHVRHKRRRTVSCGDSDGLASASSAGGQRLPKANVGRSFSDPSDISSGSSDGDEEDEEEDDDDDTGHERQQQHPKGRGRGMMNGMLYKRRQATPKQVVLLEQVFAVEPIPTSATKLRLAEVLEMSPKKVTVWFKNKRARQKKKGFPLPHSSSSSSSSSSSQPGYGIATTNAANAPTRQRSDLRRQGFTFHYFDEDRAIAAAAQQ